MPLPVGCVLVVVTVRPKRESVREFERAIDDVIASARTLPGCLRYDWFRSPDSSNVLAFAEFESEEAFAAYRSGPVVQRIGREILPLLDGRPRFRHYHATVLEEG